jgi:formate dehydrogenase accessory protein FdhE
VTTTYAGGLWQLAEQKWAGIAGKFPELDHAITLQKSMLRLLIDARERLEDSQPALPEVTRDAILGKWRRGVPALRNETLAIPEELKNILPPLCDVLAGGGAGESAAHIRDALATGEIDAGSLLRVSLARNRTAIRTSSLHHGFSADLVWVIGELASSPLAHYCQTHLLNPRELRPADAGWDRGYCPCCGSWPAFIEALDGEDGRGFLRCSYCAATWQLTSRRCTYCGTADGRFMVAAPDMESAGRRLELCGACGNYTKVIDVASLTPFPLIAIEDLATMDLDQGAMQRGYRRPDLFDLDALEPPTSPNCG